MKRSYSLRTWMLVGIVGLVLVPYIGTFGLVLITGMFEPEVPREEPPHREREAVELLYRRVESQSARWEEPSFLAEVQPNLDALRLSVRVIAPDGRVILSTVAVESVRYGPVERSYVPAPRLRQAAVYQGEREVGQVFWYDQVYSAPPAYSQVQNVIIGWIGIPALIVGTIALAVWLASRAVLAPLKKLSLAAGKINRGELDFDVPTSAVREVTEFAGAFDQMRAGLKESLTRQAAMEQERRMFIAAMAHDLRTPLSSVRGYLEGLRDGVASTPEKRERYISVALEKTGSLERLIESLFAFARTEYLEQPPQMESLVLGELLEGALSGLRPRAEAKGVTLRLDDGPEPCQISGDALMLARVIDNLLDNAIRHTPAGGEVTVGWRHGVDRCRFWVQDSGPGIPPGELAQVFEPLYRGDKARGTRTGGAGLGLAIAKRLVEAHGGEISVENWEGARFTVVLPVS